MITPSFQSHSDAKRFLVDKLDENGDKDGCIPISLNVSCVVITTAFGDTVAFTKTNRGKNYRDSRGKKTVAKNSYGEKTETIRPLFISESEVKAELIRLLDDNYLAEQAFNALQY